MPASTSLESSSEALFAAANGGYWTEIARQWDLIGPPLRPTAEDLAVCEAAISQWLSTGHPHQSRLRVLVLGATQELYRLAWPLRSEITALDRTQGMIDALWPGSPGTAICGDWTEMPLDGGSRDIALCDGGTIMLPYPDGSARLVRELHRVLVPGGLSIFRLYVQPTQPETADAVLKDLLAGRVPNTNVLKLRLGMALQQDTQSGVQLAHIWDTLHHAAPDLQRLAEQLGWVPDELRAINAYRNCATRYAFHTTGEILSLFTEKPGGFSLKSLHVPTYSLGDRCPTVVFHRDQSPLDKPAGIACISANDADSTE